MMTKEVRGILEQSSTRAANSAAGIVIKLLAEPGTRLFLCFFINLTGIIYRFATRFCYSSILLFFSFLFFSFLFFSPLFTSFLFFSPLFFSFLFFSFLFFSPLFFSFHLFSFLFTSFLFFSPLFTSFLFFPFHLFSFLFFSPLFFSPLFFSFHLFSFHLFTQLLYYLLPTFFKRIHKSHFSCWEILLYILQRFLHLTYKVFVQLPPLRLPF